MKIFLDNKAEWIIGIACTFLPAIVGKLIQITSSIPDIQVPFWIVCLLLSIPLAFIAVRQYGKKIKTIANKKYGVEKVKICGKHFVSCEFDGTELEFDASAPTSMGHCNLIAPRIRLSGSAELTMSYMVNLYSDPSLRYIVDATFKNIIEQGLNIEKSRSSKS